MVICNVGTAKTSAQSTTKIAAHYGDSQLAADPPLEAAVSAFGDKKIAVPHGDLQLESVPNHSPERTQHRSSSL